MKVIMMLMVIVMIKLIIVMVILMALYRLIIFCFPLFLMVCNPTLPLRPLFWSVCRSIGDSYLGAVKRSTSTAHDVRVLRLAPDPQRSRVTVVVLASDGLWDSVQKRLHSTAAFARLVGGRLTSCAAAAAHNLNQRLAEDLTAMAVKTERDDVTVAVSCHWIHLQRIKSVTPTNR